MHRRELGAKGIRAQAGSLRDAVHLPRSCADRHPYELSGGRRQRAGLARALALRPKPVVADGPTSAPDVPVQAKVLGLFTELQREPGFAALFAGHDPAVVEQAADRVVVPHRGRIAEEGATSQVLGSPQDDCTRRLVAAVPVPDPVRQARRRYRHRPVEEGVAGSRPPLTDRCPVPRRHALDTRTSGRRTLTLQVPDRWRPSMRVPHAAPHGGRTGTRLITRRHVDYCRTSSAVCPSAHV